MVLDEAIHILRIVMTVFDVRFEMFNTRHLGDICIIHLRRTKYFSHPTSIREGRTRIVFVNSAFGSKSGVRTTLYIKTI